MTKQIQKSFQECLSKIKIANRTIQFQIRGCKHPKTPSLAVPGKEKEDDAVTLSDIDQFLFENFRSLYQKEYEEDIAKNNDSKTSPFPFESPGLTDTPPLETLCRSARFFVKAGSSSSLITAEGCSSSSSSSATEDYATTDSSAAAEESEEINEAGGSSSPDDFIALLTYSPSPYEDFRRSMQEMVEARLEHNGKVDWEFMEELLFCYLDLNNKKSYKFILRAYVDLIVSLRENFGKIPATVRRGKGGMGEKN